MRKRAKVHTNDPDRQEFTIGLVFNVQPIFQIAGQKHPTLKTVVGKAIEQSFELTNTLDGPVEITDLSHKLGDQLAVKLETLEKGRRYRIDLSTPAARPLRRLRRIRLHLKGAPVENTSIRVFLDIRPQPPVHPEKTVKQEALGPASKAKQPSRPKH